MEIPGPRLRTTMVAQVVILIPVGLAQLKQATAALL